MPVPLNKHSVTLSFPALLLNKFGLIFVLTFAFLTLSPFITPCSLGRPAAPDSLDASLVTVFKLVMQSHSILYGLYTVRLSTTVFLPRVLRFRPASATFFSVTFRPSIPLVLLVLLVLLLPSPPSF